MNDDTIQLLQECNAGCKSATNSMEQVKEFIKDDALMQLIDEYNDKHIKLGDECHQMLNELNQDEKDPNIMAKAFSRVSTELKLMINPDSTKIADIMVDGCTYGIKSVSGYINQYKAASKDSIALAEKLVSIEQEFMNKLLKFL